MALRRGQTVPVRGSRIVAPNAVAVLIGDAQSGLRPRMT